MHVEMFMVLTKNVKHFEEVTGDILCAVTFLDKFGFSNPQCNKRVCFVMNCRPRSLCSSAESAVGT